MNETKTKPIMNEVERIRKERDESICREWEETAPAAVRDGVPPSRILASIAAKRGMTAQGVEVVLRRAGIYEGAREFKKEVVNQNEESHEK